MFDAPEADAVNATLQLAVGTVPATRLQLVELKLPATPAWVKETLPVGVVAPTVEVSVTVTVHVDGWLTSTGLEQGCWCWLSVDLVLRRWSRRCRSAMNYRGRWR